MSKSARPYNFSAGPAILPQPVFDRVSEAVKQLRIEGDTSLEARLSILEISHRSKTYDAIHEHAIELCHRVIGIPRTHKVLFLQGGASLQFAMVPMNLRVEGKPAAYVDTGSWSKKAIKESKVWGPTEVLASSADTAYDRLPPFPSADRYAGASYLHITTNNTIYGTEYPEIPEVAGDVPLVADMSSNIASRPMALERVALGYAGAQKNLGPSGLGRGSVRRRPCRGRHGGGHRAHARPCTGAPWRRCRSSRRRDHWRSAVRGSRPSAYSPGALARNLARLRMKRGAP